MVTGGAGFIGSHVVDRLCGLGSVTVVDDLSAGRAENLEAASATGGVRLLKADVRDPEALRGAFRGADVVFHLAAKCLRISLSDPALVHGVNATGTLNALRAAREEGVGRFVYVSSSEVYGTAGDATPIDETHPLRPHTPYAASKAAGELYALSFLRTSGLAATVVRPFNSYGPRSHVAGPYGEVIPRFVVRLLAGEAPVIFGDGRQTRDFTFVEDTARGIVAAAVPTAVGEVLNIGCGREVSVQQLARAAAAACGRPDVAPIFREARPGDVRRHLASTSKAERLIGYRSEVGLDEGLRRYVRWVRERGVEIGAAEAGRPNW